MAKYREVYFRIRSAYQGYSGWPSEEASQQFRDDSRRLFESIGWTIQPGHSGHCDIAVKGSQDLYLHPQSFSGVILEKNIPIFQKLFEQATTFRCTAIDRYAEYFDLSDEAYMAQLEAQRDDIASDILTQLRTSRSNLYVTEDVAPKIAKPYTVKRVCDKTGYSNLAQEFVKQLMEEMIADGRLVTAETRHGIGIRTATEKELRAPQEERWGGQQMFM